MASARPAARKAGEDAVEEVENGPLMEKIRAEEKAAPKARRQGPLREKRLPAEAPAPKEVDTGGRKSVKLADVASLAESLRNKKYTALLSRRFNGKRLLSASSKSSPDDAHARAG